MVSCQIKGCKNRSDKKGQPKLRFFSFPKDPETASKWIEVCKHTVNIKNSRVCSAHFQPSCYKPRPLHLKDLNYSQSGVRTLLPDAIPTESILTEDLKATHKLQKSVQNSSATNINNFKILNISDAKIARVNEKVPAVLYLQLLENDPKTVIKSVSTPLTSVKYISGHSNLDVRLERVEAPAHILDHQYAAKQNPNSNVLDSAIEIENENHSTEDYKITDFQILPKLNIAPSNEQQIIKLKKQLLIKTLEHQAVQNQLKRLQIETKSVVNRRIREVLKNVFSTRQIDKLLNPNKTKIRWSIEDIITAISLQNISIKAYRFLRDNNYPLPGLSTIRKWTANIKITEGLLTDILTLMKYRGNSLLSFQKIVVLSFGQIVIAQKKCMICMVRGLFYKWIQPVYYSFETRLTANVLTEIISKLYDIKYIVVAIICNLQILDAQVKADLNIENHRQNYFHHPTRNDYKVFIFPCESNLLSIIGQKFFNNGFIAKGKHVNKQCTEEIAEIDSNKERENICRLIPEVWKAYKSDYENTFLIKKLFTKIIASEIAYFGNKELILYQDWKDTAEFFELFGKWIVLCNSHIEEGIKEGEEPYGYNLEYQNKILNKMENLMRNTKVAGSEKSLIFQDLVILKCHSLKELLIYLKQTFSTEDFQIKYIFTSRFSNELLENVYDYLSDKDASNHSGSITTFQHKLRKCLLGNNLHDASFRKALKSSEPCLIDFNEKSDSTVNDIKNPKELAMDTAGKIRRFLTLNKIPKQRVHKILLNILSKNETEI